MSLVVIIFFTFILLHSEKLFQKNNKTQQKAPMMKLFFKKKSCRPWQAVNFTKFLTTNFFIEYLRPTVLFFCTYQLDLPITEIYVTFDLKIFIHSSTDSKRLVNKFVLQQKKHFLSQNTRETEINSSKTSLPVKLLTQIF